MKTSSEHVIVIGGGIAGVSAAYYLAKSQVYDRITVVEAEPTLAYHTTGRSAALLTENYGAGPTRPLTTASLDFWHHPPDALVDHPLIEPRGIITVSTSPADHDELELQLAEGADTTHPVEEIPATEAAQLAPHINFGPGHRAMYEAHAHDIDVAATHQAFVRGLRAEGATTVTSHRVDSAVRSGDGWTIETTSGPMHADVIVNAAGAWGDLVAERAGLTPIGLMPLKRTAFMVTSPFGESNDYTFVADVQHRWYLRPDGAQFMCSPADEQPSEPCDARADEVDIARTIDLLNEHTKLNIRSVNSHWAGLRTFGPDRSMVLGPDTADPKFVWCVGQGGTGIQTSPGAGQLVADLVTTGKPSAALLAAGVDVTALSPSRLDG